jgi:hypothetical protein
MSKLAGSVEGEKTLKTERLLFEPLLPKHAPLLHGALANERLYRFIPADAPESVGRSEPATESSPRGAPRTARRPG